MGSNEKNRSTRYNIGKPNWNQLKQLPSWASPGIGTAIAHSVPWTNIMLAKQQGLQAIVFGASSTSSTQEWNLPNYAQHDNLIQYDTTIHNSQVQIIKQPSCCRQDMTWNNTRWFGTRPTPRAQSAHVKVSDGIDCGRLWLHCSVRSRKNETPCVTSLQRTNLGKKSHLFSEKGFRTSPVLIMKKLTLWKLQERYDAHCILQISEIPCKVWFPMMSMRNRTTSIMIMLMVPVPILMQWWHLFDGNGWQSSHHETPWKL